MIEAKASRPRVLLVEDDAAVRRSLQLLLQGRGFDVRSFASGAAVLADPASIGAACLVTDYRMPDADGLAILAEMQRRGWMAPAVLITAFHSPQLEKTARDMGFGAVIEKPMLDQSLTDAMARLLIDG